MKLTNLSAAGAYFGLGLAMSSWVRYFIIFPDLDKAFFFGLIGLIIIGISWNYVGRVQLNNDIEKLNNTLTDLEQYVADKKI